MKIKVLTLFMLLAFGVSFAQSDTVTIYDIQYQSPETIETVDNKSPYEGKLVTVTGVVMNRPMLEGTTAMLAAGAHSIYLQDPSFNEHAAILVRFPNNPTTAFDQLDTGYVIRVTGKVQEYNQTTQLNITDFQAEDVLGIQNRPEPIDMPLDSLVHPGSGDYKAIAEKWEAMRVRFTNLIVTEANATGTGAFKVADNSGTPLIVYNQSNYFRGKQSPNPGTALEYLVGHVTTSTQYGNEINPVYPNDRKFGSVVPPNISNVKRDSATVAYNQKVGVTAEVKDIDGTVTSANLYYSVNNGELKKVGLTGDSSKTKWSGQIPGQTDSAYVEYFIEALDDQLNKIIEPSDTSRSRFSYFVLNRPISIREIQYSPRGSGYSPYNSYTVTVSGVVTSDTNYFYMQDGNLPWSGINLFLTDSVKIGDKITVTGRVEESFNLTRITAITDFSRISSDNPVEPVELLTSAISKASNNTPSAEQWEGMLVKYNDVTITDINADGNPGEDEGSGGNRNYGELFIADQSGVDTRIELQDGARHKYHNTWDSLLVKDPSLTELKLGDKFASITGFLEYTFSNYKLAPRTNSDFVGYIPVRVEQKNEILPDRYSLAQNYPNPFNPSTTINFGIAKPGMVKLVVYNVIGEKIQTLVNSYYNAGQYKAVFNASNLPSGIYFYELQTPDYTNVKKMMLVK